MRPSHAKTAGSRSAMGENGSSSPAAAGVEAARSTDCTCEKTNEAGGVRPSRLLR
jgi:hypothetical protein